MNGSLVKGIDRFFLRLSTRERWVLGGGIITAISLILYMFVVGPMWERKVVLDRLIPQKEKEIREFSRLKGEYAAVSQEIEGIERRLPSAGQFSPLSFLEETANQNQLRGNIAYIRPLAPQVHEPYREIQVEIKVENVALARVVPFLTAVENAPYPVRIKRLALKTRFSDPSLMDATFLVSAYEKGEGG
ncbi:MAG: type II secretion system protein GspM [Candidatus Manganitrophaceae bacterium]